MIDHFTFFFQSTKYHSWHKNCFFCARHSVNLFIHRFGTVWNFLLVLFQGLHVNWTFSSRSLFQTPTNEGEHKSKFITNYYSWFWNIYSFLCKPNIIDTSILMFFLHVMRSFNIGMMEWSAMMKNDFSEACWRDYVYKLKCFKLWVNVN